MMYEPNIYNTCTEGDLGYTASPVLLTQVPYDDPKSPEGMYSTLFSSLRSMVERSIGDTKGIWRAVNDERTMCREPEKAKNAILVTAVLHNYQIDP